MKFFFFHGMGGGPRDWNAVRALLPGEAPVLPVGGSFAELVRALTESLADEKSPVLCGYSMGGRVAIAVAEALLARGKKPRGLALLGAGLGFSSSAEQANRRVDDEKWARLAELNPIAFWEEWYQQPLFVSFRSLPPNVKDDWLAQRKSMNISSLTNQLRAWGPAQHPYLRSALESIRAAGISTLYLAGELDKKYLDLGHELARSALVELAIIPGAGHILPLEAPEKVAQRLREFFPARE